METTIMGFQRVYGPYKDYLGMMEKNMETTIMAYIGVDGAL